MERRTHKHTCYACVRTSKATAVVSVINQLPSLHAILTSAWWHRIAWPICSMHAHVCVNMTASSKWHCKLCIYAWANHVSEFVFNWPAAIVCMVCCTRVNIRNILWTLCLFAVMCCWPVLDDDAILQALQLRSKIWTRCSTIWTNDTRGVSMMRFILR